MPKLYEIPDGSKLRIGDMLVEATFHRIDGAYSYCTRDSDDYEVEAFHLSANAPMKLCDDGVYEMKE